MLPTLLDVIQRTREGNRLAEQDFDFSIYHQAEKLRNKSGIRYDPQQPVPTSDEMADELFEMGLRFFLEVGVYCTDTGRVLHFAETEVREALASAPSRLVLGQGKDAVTIASMRLEGEKRPVVTGGIQTIPFSSEERMLQICTLCARDRYIDGIWGGTLKRLDGHNIIAKTPNEVQSYRKTASILRSAVAKAGRPGMYIIQNAPTAVGTIGMYGGESGLRPTDPIQPTAISEMKVCYDDLNRSAYAASAGIPIIGVQSATIGAFSGSIEGAAIVAVASALQSLMVHGAGMQFTGVIHFSKKSGVCREILWSLNLALQAASRNSSLILCADGGAHPASGPGTREYFYEAAAGFISAVVCGAHPMGGTRKYFVGEREDCGSPLESHWMGVIAKNAGCLSRAMANRIVCYLLDKYEPCLGEAPDGFVFEHLYDLVTMEPRREYMALYDSVKTELADQGFKFDDEVL